MLDRSHKPPPDPIEAAQSILAKLTGEEPATIPIGLTLAQRKTSAVKAAHDRWRKKAETA